MSDDPNTHSATWGSSETLQVQVYDSQAPFFDHTDKAVILPRHSSFNFFTYYYKDREYYTVIYKALDINSK